MNGILYRIFNIKNGKSYIGKTYSGFYNRLRDHIKDKDRYPNRPLYRALNKYGLDNFSAEILGEYAEGELELKEIEFIKTYNSYGASGYNATLGGEGKRYLSIPIDSLIKEYLVQEGNITATATKFSIDFHTCKKLLIDAQQTLLVLDRSKAYQKVRSKAVYIPEADMSFDTPYDCAIFLKECGIADTTTSNNRVAMSIRRVCSGLRKEYLGIYFEYLD